MRHRALPIGARPSADVILRSDASYFVSGHV